MKSTWCGGMIIEQVEMLEKTFAELTPDGWIIPDWVTSLRRKIEARDRPNSGPTDEERFVFLYTQSFLH